MAFAVAADQGAGDTISVSGTGAAGDTVKLYDGSALIGSATVMAAGTWTTAPLLAIGSHTLSATQSDSYGQTSSPSPTQTLAIAAETFNDVTFYGTAGVDQFTGGRGSDTFVFAAADLGSGDKLVGGAGNDTLVLTSAGSIAAAGVSGVETIRLGDGGANSVVLSNANFAGVGGGAIQVVGGAAGNTVDASVVSGGNQLVFTGGAGDDIVLPGSLATIRRRRQQPVHLRRYRIAHHYRLCRERRERPGVPRQQLQSRRRRGIGNRGAAAPRGKRLCRQQRRQFHE